LPSTPPAPATTSTHGFHIVVFVSQVALEQVEWIALHLVRICLPSMAGLQLDVILEWMANWVACISTHKRLLVLVIEHGKISVTSSDSLFRCSTGYCDAQGRTVGSPLIRHQMEGTIRHQCAWKLLRFSVGLRWGHTLTRIAKILGVHAKLHKPSSLILAIDWLNVSSLNGLKFPRTLKRSQL